MRVVLQRVSGASVKVDGNIIGQIDKGIMVLVGFKQDDNEKIMDYMIEKIINLRIFEDENDKMNLSLKDINGQLLIIPNFTLYGDCRKGRRPSYSGGAPSSQALEIYLKFVTKAKGYGLEIKTGKFGADMEVSLVNDGPITLLVDSDKEF